VYSEFRLDAKADAFVNELKMLESAARMYYYEHNGAKPGDTAAVSSYLPERFSFQPNCVGGWWRYWQEPGVFIVVCDHITKETKPIVERAMEKMIKANPQNRNRFSSLFERSGGFTLDYSLEHKGDGGDGTSSTHKAVSSLF
jgi:hypothetical protein